MRSGFCARSGGSRNKVVPILLFGAPSAAFAPIVGREITSLQTSLQRFGPSIAKTLQFKTYLFVELTLNQWPNHCSSQTTIGYEPGEGIVSRPIQTVARACLQLVREDGFSPVEGNGIPKSVFL